MLSTPLFLTSLRRYCCLRPRAEYSASKIRMLTIRSDSNIYDI